MDQILGVELFTVENGNNLLIGSYTNHHETAHGRFWDVTAYRNEAPNDNVFGLYDVVWKEPNGRVQGTLEISPEPTKSTSHLTLTWRIAGHAAFKGIGVIHDNRISTIYWSIEIDEVINPK